MPGDERGAGTAADLSDEVGLITGGVAFDDLQAEARGQRADGPHRTFAVAAGMGGGVDGIRPSQLAGRVAGVGANNSTSAPARIQPVTVRLCRSGWPSGFTPRGLP